MGGVEIRMTYKLAFELKNAGFPLKEHKFYDDFSGVFDRCYNCPELDKEGVMSWCVPTLSELIEACGDKFIDLALVRREISPELREREGQWYASAGMPLIEIYSHTPSEAVARLWLELNKVSP